MITIGDLSPIIYTRAVKCREQDFCQCLNLTSMLLCRKGEEVTHCYNWDNERNDYSLIHYFFIQKLDPPRLCAIDLPSGSLDGGFTEPDDRYLPHEKGAIQVITV